MISACERTAERLPAFVADTLPEADRRDLRGHLRTCPACRVRAVEVDPTLLFSALPEEEVSSRDVARVLDGVRAGIAWRERERKMPRRRARAARFVSAAAVVATTLLLPAGLRLTRDEPASAGSAAVASRPAPGAPRPEPVSRELAKLAAPDEKDQSSNGATIYDWTPGSGQPRVVWIVDRSLDI